MITTKQDGDSRASNPREGEALAEPSASKFYLFLFASLRLCVTIGFLTFAACSNTDSTLTNTTQNVTSLTQTIDYSGYTKLLNTHVDKSGMVDYSTLQQNSDALDTFLKTLTSTTRKTYNGWTQNDQLAFWINAYNAITLREIIDHYPIQKGSLINRSLYPENSIRQIKGVWKTHTTNLLGQDITLHQIENAVIRTQFDEPRIHFAIVCASIGCPPLRNEAFTGPKLEAQLNDQTRRFLSGPDKFIINSEKKKIHISPIFDWFESDFKDPGIRAFLADYASEGSATFINDPKFKIKYLDYDWSLNEQP